MYRNFLAMLVSHRHSCLCNVWTVLDRRRPRLRGLHFHNMLMPGGPTFRLISVPHHTVGAPLFAAQISVLHTRLIAAQRVGLQTYNPHIRRKDKISATPKGLRRWYGGGDLHYITCGCTGGSHFSDLRRAEICS